MLKNKNTFDITYARDDPFVLERRKKFNQIYLMTSMNSFLQFMKQKLQR